MDQHSNALAQYDVVRAGGGAEIGLFHKVWDIALFLNM